MALRAFGDRIKVLTSTTGTGTLTLTTAVAQHQLFLAAMDGLEIAYTILDVNGTAWETGVGTYTHSGTTLTRGLVSSSTGSLITLSATGSTVLVGQIAQDAESNYYAIRSIIMGGVITLPSTTTVNIGAMTAFVESLNRVCRGPAPAAAITPTLSAGAVRYIYASFASGVWTLTDSATAPIAFATPAGNARSMSGDTSKRFVGAIFSNAGATAIIAQLMYDLGGGRAEIQYTHGLAVAPLRVLSAGAATSFTSQSLVTVIPPNIGLEIMARIVSTTTAGNPDGQFFLSLDATQISSEWAWYVAATANPQVMAWVPIIPATPSVNYKVNNAVNVGYFDCGGYRFMR